MTMFWAMLIKPFVLLAMLCIAYPFVVLFTKYFPDGKIKRLLLRRW